MKLKKKAVSNNKETNGKQRRFLKTFIFTVIKMLVIIGVAVSCAAAGILGGAIYGYIKTAPLLTPEQLEIKNLTTFIYDRRGNEIARLTGKENKNREWVDYNKIPEYLKHAFVAVEDERFFTHPGVDLRGFINATLNFLTNGKLGRSGGGSTITMQLVRNITGRFDRNIQRKIQEQWAALHLERKWQKWQILEHYMNIIFLGNGCYGVQSASKTYFGKEVTDLSLAQCAYLAGITNSPALYNPFTEKGRENAKKRQEIILNLMLEQGYIKQKEYEQALKEEIRIADPDESLKNIAVQTYFVDQVILDLKKDLMAVKGYSEEMALTIIYSGGLKIETTQDPDIQKAMDEVFLDDKYFPANLNKKAAANMEHPQGSMVVLDAETGQIMALYGGCGEKKASNTLNRATQIKRQPGSSIKPIAVYAPAIDLGLITPATIIDDVPVYMMTTGKDKDKPYPTNYDRQYDGLTSIRNAIKASINVVAAKVWRDILGPDQSVAYLKKVGINREKEKYVSLALGGLENGVNPLLMSAAYLPFANKGMYYEPITYTKVYDSDKNILLEKKQEYHAAYNETTAFIMTDMLKEVCKPRNTAYPHGGTASSIITEKTIGMPVAGKTGTTSEHIDKWFVGYTPYYVAAAWYGYDNKIKPITLAKEEYNQAQIIWQAVMKKIHEKKQKKDFEAPPGLVKKRICIYSGKIATELCLNDPRGNATIEEYFVKGTEPRYDDLCDVHVKASVCRDCKDAWGRNLLSGPYCPLESVIEKVFVRRKEPFVPVRAEDKYPKDWIYELPEGEYCTVHGAPPEYGGSMRTHDKGGTEP